MLNNLTFSISIPTVNRYDDLFRCLSSLSKQTYSDFDVIVINGGTYEGVKRVVDNFNNLKIKIVEQKGKGCVDARNLAWRHSQADVVCILDDDLVVSPEWLENVKKTFLEDEHIGGVSGPTIIPEDRQGNRDLIRFLKEFKQSRNFLLKLIGKIYFGIILENKVSSVGKILKSGAFTPGSNYKSCLELTDNVEVDYLEACHMCFKRKVLEELNGFDYIYTGTGEGHETDFSCRVRRKGYRLVFCPKAITYHCITPNVDFKLRTNSYERSKNFIFFYMRCIKPNSLGKIVHFGTYLLFINLYWCYKFLQTRNSDWLKGITGTFVGLLEANKYASIYE